MRALSFTQPWVWIMLNLGKNIENRTRNLGNYRGTLLMHASKKMTYDDYMKAVLFVRERFGEEVAAKIPDFMSQHKPDHDGRSLVLGAIVGVCEVVNQLRPGGAWQPEETPRPAPDMRWYMGEHAYLLERVRELTTPIPCKGALGLWRPPESVEAAVRTWMLGGERP